MPKTAIAKCGHEVEVIAPDTECEDFPDSCPECENDEEQPTTTYTVVYECADGFLDDITIKAFNDHEARQIAFDSIEEGATIKSVRLA